MTPFMVSVLVLGSLWTAQTGVPWISPCPVMCRCKSEDGTVLKVDCVDQGLTQVPSNLSSFTSVLDLSMNQVWELPAQVFSRLHRLRELRLAGNRLQQIHREAFSGLSALTVLTLHDTDLRTVPSEALDKLTNLQSLRLDANRLSRVPASSFRRLSSLRHLWLEDNALELVPGGALTHSPRLQALTLGLNHIRRLPDRAFSKLRELLVLHLHHNQIHSLSPRCFYGLHQLQTLDLSFNRLHTFPSGFQFLTCLKELNLQNNRISFVPEKAFRGNPSMKKINLLNNPLCVVADFTKLSKLQSPRFSLPSQNNPPQPLKSANHNRLDSCQTQDSFMLSTLFLFIVFLVAVVLSYVKIEIKKYSHPGFLQHFPSKPLK